MNDLTSAELKVSRKPKYALIQEDWISKSLAGFFLGLALAFIASSLFALVGPGGLEAPNKVQFNMWMVPPVWLVIFSLVYMFPSGARAWLWLGGFTLAGALALTILRLL